MNNPIAITTRIYNYKNKKTKMNDNIKLSYDVYVFPQFKNSTDILCKKCIFSRFQRYFYFYIMRQEQ